MPTCVCVCACACSRLNVGINVCAHVCCVEHSNSPSLSAARHSPSGIISKALSSILWRPKPLGLHASHLNLMWLLSLWQTLQKPQCFSILLGTLYHPGSTVTAVFMSPARSVKKLWENQNSSPSTQSFPGYIKYYPETVTFHMLRTQIYKTPCIYMTYWAFIHCLKPYASMLFLLERVSLLKAVWKYNQVEF